MTKSCWNVPHTSSGSSGARAEGLGDWKASPGEGTDVTAPISIGTMVGVAGRTFCGWMVGAKSEGEKVAIGVVVGALLETGTVVTGRNVGVRVGWREGGTVTREGTLVGVGVGWRETGKAVGGNVRRALGGLVSGGGGRVVVVVVVVALMMTNSSSRRGGIPRLHLSELA